MLVYRVPTKPARWRMMIRRDLQRIGGLFLQQCVYILPQRDDLHGELARVTATIAGMGGECTFFDIPVLKPADEEKIIAAFRDLRDREYAEIVAECEGMLAKEIKFAHTQPNYTVAEIAEIKQSLEKVRRWYDRVVSRDWFEAAECKRAET